MNLKEAFRYQCFLDEIFNKAMCSLRDRDHCLKYVKLHKCSKANPNVDDFEEIVETDDYFENDKVLQLAAILIVEKEKLTSAINNAKAAAEIDIDALTEKNKYRQHLYKTIRSMLTNIPGKKIERGVGYTFNVEGNQTSYYYDIETTSEDAYNKELARVLMREAISESDDDSAKIDVVKINTIVDYDPLFNVNDSFEDVMNTFI